MVFGFSLGSSIESWLGRAMWVYKSDITVLPTKPIAVVFIVLTVYFMRGLLTRTAVGGLAA
jgi:TctA family transporter